MVKRFEWYKADDEKTHFKRRKPKATKLRHDITPGQVLVLLVGQFNLRPKLASLIDYEIGQAEKGKKASKEAYRKRIEKAKKRIKELRLKKEIKTELKTLSLGTSRIIWLLYFAKSPDKISNFLPAKLLEKDKF